MNLPDIFLIAVALAMDAFAVAIAAGVSLKSVNARQRFRLSWHFGLFQALMPILGWLAGNSIRSFIEAYDHWIAFGLLAFIGGHMIKDFFSRDDDDTLKADPTKGRMMVLLSVSTSIDALAVGLSMSMLNVTIALPALIIGLVAGGFTLLGLEIGSKVGTKSQLSPYAQMIGGVILFLIGLNILREHEALQSLQTIVASLGSFL